MTAQLLCVSPRRDGKPCRGTVSPPGPYCYSHGCHETDDRGRRVCPEPHDGSLYCPEHLPAAEEIARDSDENYVRLLLSGDLG